MKKLQAKKTHKTGLYTLIHVGISFFLEIWRMCKHGSVRCQDTRTRQARQGGMGEKPSTGEWGASFCVMVIRSSTYSRRQPNRWRTQMWNDVSGPRVSGHKASIIGSPRTRNGRRHRRSGTRCGSRFWIGM